MKIIFIFIQEITVANSSNKIWQFNTTLINGAYFQLIVSFSFPLVQNFDYPKISHLLDPLTNITFANETTAYTANSLKLSLNITNWPFKSSRNSLGLVFGASAITHEGSEAYNLRSGSYQTGDLKWLTVSTDNITLYPRSFV